MRNPILAFQSKRAQSLVEMAIATPVLLTLALFSVDIGRAFYYKESVTNAARQALRATASSYNESAGDNACSGGGSSVTQSTTLPASSGNNLYTIANLVAEESSTNGTPGGSAISGAVLTVTWNCSSGLALTNETAATTDPSLATSPTIHVHLVYTMPFMTPLVQNYFGTPGAQIASDIYGGVNY